MRKEKPDTILTHDGRFIRYLNKLGFRVPEDISVVHLNHGPDVEDWSGWRSPDEQMGEHAVELLVESIQTNSPERMSRPRRVVLQGHFIDGWTAPIKENPQPPLEERQLRFLHEGGLSSAKDFVKKHAE